MNINDLLAEKKITQYRLSKISGVPFSTISDICTEKARIEKCSAETVYKLAKALGVAMESLVLDSMECRPNFEIYKSSVCHQVRIMRDINFIIHMLESDTIRKLYQKKWYPESLYLLAMVDYLSRENGLPVCSVWNDLRVARLREPLYPASVLTMCAALESDEPKMMSRSEAIPEFIRFNIVESEVRDVV